MTNVEKVKKVRELTLSPVNKVNEALQRSDWDIDAAVKLLIAEKQADANDMANRAANTSIVYSYVHNNRIGAMLSLACQTDFVAKNESFLALAKDICMHIVSTPVCPEYVDKNAIDPRVWQGMVNSHRLACQGKPPQVIEKIVEGKMQKYYSAVCLLDQKFIKDDSKTVAEVINEAASTLGEKIEVKRFIKMVAQYD